MVHPVAERETVFQRGLEAYRSGNHYDAHEYWEDLWKSEEDDQHRLFLQGLIQVASAVHKFVNGVAPRGAPRLLERALVKFQGLPDHYGGVDLGRFREAAARLGPILDRMLLEGRKDLDSSLIPPLERVGDALSWKKASPGVPPDPTQTLRKGLVAYQDGRYYDALETWEKLRQHEPDGVLKTFLHGLVLLASAMHKVFSMKSPKGAEAMLEMAEERIRQAPEGTCGVAVQALAGDVARAKEAIVRGLAGGDSTISSAIVPKINRAGSG